MWFSSLSHNSSLPSMGPNARNDKGEESQVWGELSTSHPIWAVMTILPKKKIQIKINWRTDTWFTDLVADSLPILPHPTEYQMTIANDNFGENKESVWCLSIFSCWIWQQYLCCLDYWSELCWGLQLTIWLWRASRGWVCWPRVSFSTMTATILRRGEWKQGLMSSTKNNFNAIESDSPCISWTVHGFSTAPLP